ncbi:hypothetical protein PVAP13_5KG693432 [Panicum virgatum]|uniref:Uncharacterized protein n=1 Tax=Panicum virgatum TaxID=38727 RepID=A0A8T0SSE2_PANVG|nr:hypothetical protein PVAP13_5KG693432 [Panicum virgatum]
MAGSRRSPFKFMTQVNGTSCCTTLSGLVAGVASVTPSALASMTSAPSAPSMASASSTSWQMRLGRQTGRRHRERRKGGGVGTGGAPRRRCEGTPAQVRRCGSSKNRKEGGAAHAQRECREETTEPPIQNPRRASSRAMCLLEGGRLFSGLPLHGV